MCGVGRQNRRRKGGSLSPRVDVVGRLVLVFMGVAGSGKTTVAAILAGRLGWKFEEGDDLHPPANIEKMHAGHPLTDDDRRPWLEQVARWIDERLDKGENGLITCSALKRSYRDVINRRGQGIVFVFLKGSHETIAGRLATRHGHFMPSVLLESQFADLEAPDPDEPAISFDVGPPPGVIAQEIMESLRLGDPTEVKPT
jgi:gluconokinase